jgi:hypothetical protein
MEFEDVKHDEDELDTQLSALFRSADPLTPSVAFTSRTMKAVMREPLPASRRPLRTPFGSLAGWAALIASVALSAWAIAVNQPLFASAFTMLISGGIGLGVWLIQLAGMSLAVSEVFAITGRAVSRAIVTKEGSTGLILIALVGAASLSTLRYLMSERPEGGVSQWQEL